MPQGIPGAETGAENGGVLSPFYDSGLHEMFHDGTIFVEVFEGGKRVKKGAFRGTLCFLLLKGCFLSLFSAS